MQGICSVALFAGLSCLSISVSAGEDDIGKGLKNFAPAKMIENKNLQHDYWNGVGRVNGARNCTGSLLDARVDGVALGPAYIATNGHCIDLTYSVILSDVPFSGAITFNHFVDTPEKSKTYKFKKASWSSMRGIDLAIVELDISLSQLIEEGIQPMSFGPRPDDGADILVVGAPRGEPLQVSACQFESADVVIQGQWVWRNTMKNRCQGIQSGSSGSPIVDRSSNLIVGLVNSIREVRQPCMLDSPCESLEKDAGWKTEVVYGISTDDIKACFSGGAFNNDPLSCKLFPVYSISGEPPRFEQNFVTENVEQNLAAIYPTWNMRFDIDMPFYRYKAVRDARDCELPHHYSVAIGSPDAYINDSIGPELGVHVLCIVGVDSEHQGLFSGIMSNALSVAVDLADLSGNDEPLAEVEKDRWGGQWMYTAYFRRASPLHHQFFVKKGMPEETDCDNPAGYNEHVFDDVDDALLSIGTESQRQTFCIYSKNLRGESSRVETYQPGAEESQADALRPAPDTSVNILFN